MKRYYRSEIIKYIQDRPNEMCFLDEMVHRLGLTRQQIQQALRQALQAPMLRDVIQVIDTGRTWMYVPRDRTQPTTVRPIAATPVFNDGNGNASTVTSIQRAEPITSTSMTGRLFEELGVVESTGDVVVTDEEGNLYRLTRVSKN